MGALVSGKGCRIGERGCKVVLDPGEILGYCCMDFVQDSLLMISMNTYCRVWVCIHSVQVSESQVGSLFGETSRYWVLYSMVFCAHGV